MKNEITELMIEISQNLAKQAHQRNVNEQFVFDRYLGMFVRLYMGANGKVFKRESVNLNTYLHTDLKMDAFEILELTTLIEKGFGFFIPDNKTNEILMRDISMNDLCKLIIECRNNPQCYIAPAQPRRYISKDVMERYMQMKSYRVATEIKEGTFR